MNMAVLDTALAEAQVQNIDAVMADVEAGNPPVERVIHPLVQDIIIDVRHPDETAAKPLTHNTNPILEIPFFRLSKRFAELDTRQRYLLYCERGVMSELQAGSLRDENHHNLAVFRPDLAKNE